MGGASRFVRAALPLSARNSSAARICSRSTTPIANTKRSQALGTEPGRSGLADSGGFCPIWQPSERRTKSGPAETGERGPGRSRSPESLCHGKRGRARALSQAFDRAGEKTFAEAHSFKTGEQIEKLLRSLPDAWRTDFLSLCDRARKTHWVEEPFSRRTDSGLSRPKPKAGPPLQSLSPIDSRNRPP